MPTRITLICHGATSASRSLAFPLDEPIEPKAAERAAALREKLRRPDRIWTSPALRARQTAEALALGAVTDPHLKDCDYGRWAGRPLLDIRQEEPENVAAWLRDAAAAPHGGESVVDLMRRVAGWLDLRGRDAGHHIVITHASVIRAAVLHALKAPAECFWHVDIGPLSIIDLRNDGHRWTWRAPLLAAEQFADT
jgi:broad specificity phosphatase PhoE